jgi:hypothetical protein
MLIDMRINALTGGVHIRVVAEQLLVLALVTRLTLSTI